MNRFNFLRGAVSAATISTGLLLGAACDKPPAEVQQEAREDQQKAINEYNDVKRSAAEQAAQAQQEANKEIAAAQEKVAEKAAETNVEVAEARREAAVDLAKARSEMRVWGQEKLNTIDKKIDDARADAVKATRAERSRFDEIMRDVDVQRESVKSEIASVETQTADTWSAFKARVEEGIDKLDDRIDEARKAL